VELHEALATRVAGWRADGYPSGRFPAIAEILNFAIENEDPAAPFPATGNLRYLRAAQLRALEVYWYLRLVVGTPKIPALYRDLFPGTDRLDALGLAGEEFLRLALELGGIDALVGRIATDDVFAREHRRDALRETLDLAYPSYILALAMGAGKTILIGAIVATEFAMAIEYPDAADNGTPFVENALVFAPGTTILEALRELADTSFERILPPRLHGPFAASVKLHFTRIEERDIPVARGSRFNLVVTNTERIRIQAQPRRAGRAGTPIGLLLDRTDEERREVANLRLQGIASLPHLAVFSDEAHHTYGRKLGTELKRVRQTVNYLAQQTNVICVVNTTGTPYFERQPLKDVVTWYGLGQGIRDGILKEVAGNIVSYAFQPGQADEFVAEVVRDFFEQYADHRLSDGSAAKLAIYFPQVDDLEELAPHVELAAARAGLPATSILRNTNRSTSQEVDDFNRLNAPTSRHRIILLVNKGTEGWNCPSLFATALARRLTNAQNFVLQAATRCLRQVPGNDRPARIYLSEANRATLDTQLQETYNESLRSLDGQRRATRRDVIRVRKRNLPALRLTRARRRVTRGPAAGAIAFRRPATTTAPLVRTIFDVGLAAATRGVLRQVGDALALDTGTDTVDAYAAATHLAAAYRLEPLELLAAMRDAYGADEVPVADLEALAGQLEAALGAYVEHDEEETVELAILRPEGFRAAPGDPTTLEADISYPVDRAALVWPPERIAENAGGYGFHYAPYNFDSTPEADLYEKVLRELNLQPDEVQDVYFTGALTDPRKTDLSFSYERDGRQHWYTPDFVIRASGDRWLLVEVKMPARRADPVEGEFGLKSAALRDLEARNPGRVVYRMVFAEAAPVPADAVAAVRAFLRAG
jgi:hypothetical protein